MIAYSAATERRVRWQVRQSEGPVIVGNRRQLIRGAIRAFITGPATARYDVKHLCFLLLAPHCMSTAVEGPSGDAGW